MTKRKIINCFDRLEFLVGNRTPAHGSEAPFLVKLLEAIAAEKKIVEDLLERDAVFADDPVPNVYEIEEAPRAKLKILEGRIKPLYPRENMARIVPPIGTLPRLEKGDDEE